MITEIFSSENLPKCKMSVRRTINIDSHMGPDSGLIYVKRDMARALAEHIMDEERLFSSERFGPSGSDILGISLDCIVLSEKELRALLNDTYMKGLDRGRRGA